MPRYKSVELVEERNRLHTEMTAVLDAAEARSEGLTAEDKSKLAQLEERFDAASEELRLAEKLEGHPGTMTPAVEPTVTEERADANAQAEQELRNFLVSGEVRADMKTSVGANGGFAVPQSWADRIVDSLKDTGVMMGLATVINTSSGAAINYPVVAGDASVGSRAELAAYAQGEPTLGTVQLQAFDYGALEKISVELIQDAAYDLEGFLAGHTALKLAQFLDGKFIKGAGTTEPKGVITAASTISAGTASLIAVDDVINLFYSIGAPYRRNGVFVAADATAAALRRLKDSTGQFLWQPAVALGQPDTILGRPFFTDPNVATVASGNRSVVFGDMSGYVIRSVGAPALRRLDELFAVNNEVGFILNQRVDGNLVDASSVKALVH